MEKIKEYLKDLLAVLEDETTSVQNKSHLRHLIESIEQAIAGVAQQNNELENRIQHLEAENDWFQSAFNALPNPVFLKDEHGEFAYVNAKYEAYFNIKSDDLLHKTVLNLKYLTPEKREKYQNEDMRLIKTSQETHYICDFPNETSLIRRALYWSKGFTTENTKQRGLIGEIVDISQQEQLKEDAENELQKLAVTNTKIQYLMKHDGLTGLYNRRIIDDFINAEYQDGKWVDLPICALLLDIDHFKCVNDNFGHLEGDRILQEFAKILEKLCRHEDLLIRYGGEEFLIITHNNKFVGGEMAERIRIYTQQHLTLPDQNHVTVSIGVAEVNAQNTFSECVQRADQAMYFAKGQGRNRVFVE